ncbi:MAG: DNA-formamidopyrimidine glycosylase family protein [Candidatus Odinarchaeota archaeon]
MPELPELLVISEHITNLLAGHAISQISVYNHIVIHGLTIEEFSRGAIGETVQKCEADGKFLIVHLNDHDIVINPMLTGRFRVFTRYRNPTRIDMVSIQTDGPSLWYSDTKKMGRVYLVPRGDYSLVAGFSDRGPSAMDPTLSLEDFTLRIKQFNGQIKSVLRNQRFLKGIGNAYADEILLYAGILPFRKRVSLSLQEVEMLYLSMKKVLFRIEEILVERSLDDITTEKRDFLMIHNKGGGICPLCGGRVSEVRANRFKTSYCQTCQK